VQLAMKQEADQKMPTSIGILGTGQYIPEQILTNQAIENALGLDENWIVRKTGVYQRHIAAPHEATSDLATRAARCALAAAGMQASDIDLIVVATSTPDWTLPATACVVQANLGATHAAAFDLSAVCTGFIYALSMVQAAMRGQESFRTALVIGAETYSRIIDYEDRKTCVLFGDGAGAVVLGRVPYGYGILASYLRADGTKTSLVQIPAGGSREAITAATLAERKHLFQMDGRGVRSFLAETFTDAIYSVLQRADLSLEDVDLIIPHQANGVILKECFRSLGVQDERVHYILERYGNTAAASVPMTLADAVRAGRVQNGSCLLLMAFGGGMTWGSTVLRWYS